MPWLTPLAVSAAVHRPSAPAKGGPPSRRRTYGLWHGSASCPLSRAIATASATTWSRTPRALGSVFVMVEPCTRFYYLEVSDADWLDGAPEVLQRALPRFTRVGLPVRRVHEPAHRVRSRHWPHECSQAGVAYTGAQEHTSAAGEIAVAEILGLWSYLLQDDHRFA